MRHKISFEIKPANKGYVLETYRWYWGFFGRRIDTIAFSNLTELTTYITDAAKDYLEA